MPIQCSNINGIYAILLANTQERAIGMPKYKIIARQMMRKINSDDMKQGDKLASIEELMKYFDVGKNTIIQVLTLLERQGYIYQVRGSGNFVRKHRRHGYINILEANGFQSTLQGFRLGSEMLDLKIIKPNTEVMANLDITEDEDVYYVKRLRSIEGRKFAVERSYYVKDIVPYLNQEIVEESIFRYLMEDLKLKSGFTDHFLRVGKLNQENAELLNLKTGDPTAFLESIYYLENGKPFDYSKIHYHYEETQFFIQGTNNMEL